MRDTAIVSGAGSGIGAAIADRLARDGAAVLLVDVDERAASRTRDRIAASGGDAGVIKADVTDSDDCAAVVRRADGFGPLTTLVNCAGMMVDDDSVASIRDTDLELLFAVNVFGAIRLSRAAIPRLRASGGGTIVNLTSVHAFATQDGVAAYAASKGAIVALTRQMAIDLAPDRIRVVAVAPGAVDTPLTRANLARRGETLSDGGFTQEPGAIGRVAEPAEVAAVVSFLASPDGSVVNGTTVLADNALTARLV